MPPIVSAAGHIRASAVRGERDIEAGAAVGAEAVAIRRLTLAGLGDGRLTLTRRRVLPTPHGRPRHRGPGLARDPEPHEGPYGRVSRDRRAGGTPLPGRCADA